RNVAVVYERSFSTYDHDVQMVLCDDDFTNPVLVFAAATDKMERNPDVAFVAGARKWICVWEHVERGESVRFHRHDSGNAYFSSTMLLLTSPGQYRQLRPVVGGSRWSATVDSEAL